MHCSKVVMSSSLSKKTIYMSLFLLVGMALFGAWIRSFAREGFADAPADDKKVTHTFNLLLGRDPSPTELSTYTKSKTSEDASRRIMEDYADADASDSPPVDSPPVVSPPVESPTVDSPTVVTPQPPPHPPSKVDKAIHDLNRVIAFLQTLQ